VDFVLGFGGDLPPHFDFPNPWLTFPVFSQYLKVETMQFMLLLKDSKNQTKYISNVVKFCQIYVVM
jgi:hypothetical protein